MVMCRFLADDRIKNSFYGGVHCVTVIARAGDHCSAATKRVDERDNLVNSIPDIPERFFGIGSKHDTARTSQSCRYCHTLGPLKPSSFRLNTLANSWEGNNLLSQDTKQGLSLL